MLISLTSQTSPNDEEVKHCEPNTSAFVNQSDLGKGTLYVAKSRLLWLSDSGQGFTLEYPTISLHAISRDLTNFHDQCLFLMIDDASNCDNSDTSGEDESIHNNEIRFVPEDKNSLEIMFKSMSECQVLHPDPNDSMSDEEEYFDDAEDNDNLHSDNALSDEYDVEVAEQLRGLPFNQTLLQPNYANGSTDETMDTTDQFEDADAEPDH